MKDELNQKIAMMEKRLMSQSQEIRFLDNQLMSLGGFVNSRADTLYILMEHLGMDVKYDEVGPKRLIGKFVRKANTPLNNSDHDIVTVFNMPFNSEVV